MGVYCYNGISSGGTHANKKENKMTVTKKVLQEQLDTLNKMIDRDYELDEARCYGGYCLTTNKGSRHVCGRRSAKETYSYLNGAIDFSGYRKLKGETV